MEPFHSACRKGTSNSWEGEDALSDGPDDGQNRWALLCHGGSPAAGTSWNQGCVVTLWWLMEPRSPKISNIPWRVRPWGRGTSLVALWAWHTPEDCVCFQGRNSGVLEYFQKEQENPSFPECSQFSKQSRSQVREDRQDGVGECGARLPTLGQTSRHSFSEQARPPEERPWININHRMLQSPLLCSEQ